ncbi:MAG: bifunctional diaminohydroxyphosphoribosylaminopyrimidine deaminase/5-amino-6-(5-phosphoribosylamino)uracil reductase RibD [Deltaproteobacteria bacterium]
MALALALGRQGLGETWPNPSVGCVIVKDMRIIGRGRTAVGGRPHAEAAALEQAGAAAKGATAYVTLEPCAHQGRDESCSDKLIRAGVARVVAAVQDPFPHVDGQGFDKLRQAGITCDTNVLQTEAEASHQGFFTRVRLGRPMVTLKLALSLDGRIATATGESKWITGPEARARVHLMRASHDAVMIGAGTARADDPELSVRNLGISRKPVRIIVSSDGNIPLDGKIVKTAPETPIWLCHGTNLPEGRILELKVFEVKLIECAAKGSRVDVADMLQNLGKRGLTRVFCEGGGQLAASLLAANQVDHLVIFHAGLALGADGRAGLGKLPGERLSDFPRFRLQRHERVGSDMLSYWDAAI